MEIGEIVKKVRMYKNISRKELSEKIGISERSLFRYESGERDIYIKTLKAISDALEFDFFLYLSKNADSLDRNALSETLEALNDEIKEIDDNLLKSIKLIMKSYGILNGLDGSYD